MSKRIQIKNSGIYTLTRYKHLYLRIIFILIVSLVFISCNEIFRKECRITDDYKYYSCDSGFNTVEDCKDLLVDFVSIDTFRIPIEKSGIAIVINDTQTFSMCIDTNNFQDYKLSDSTFWDVNSRTIIGFYFFTDWGLRAYSKVFVCRNDANMEILVKCQYEVSDQCAGSAIHVLKVAHWISIPKVSKNYGFKFKIENSNPL